MCLAVLCVSGYSVPTPEQVKERTEMLLQAIDNNDVERAKLCIKLGADVNVKCSLYCRLTNGGDKTHISGPILIRLICDEKKDLLKLLVSAGANVNAKHWYGVPVLTQAIIEGGYKDIVELLINFGADVNIGDDNNGTTALMAASSGGYKDIAELLVKSGADVNTNNSYGGTALMYAAKWGHTDVAEFLIRSGADVNAKGKDGSTALMSAASGGHTDMARLLVNAGADSRTAVVWAVKEHNFNAVKLLIELGADVNATDNDGLTLLTHSILHGRNDIADLLRAAGAKE